MNSKNKLPKKFNDLIAEKAEWTLLNTASSTFDPRKIVFVNSHRIEYRMTWFSKLFLSFFVIIGLVGLFVHKAYVFFILMGVMGLYWSSFPIVFDKNKNVFIKGRRSELFMDYVEINLSEIYAIQLIGGGVSGSDGEAYSNYQINLINEDAKRLNAVYFSNKEKAKMNAIILKDFLNTMLWDAT
jgi:hypothetical protein